jgi:hypothetical protein
MFNAKPLIATSALTSGWSLVRPPLLIVPSANLAGGINLPIILNLFPLSKAYRREEEEREKSALHVKLLCGWLQRLLVSSHDAR